MILNQKDLILKTTMLSHQPLLTAKYLKAVEARITARGHNSNLQRRVSILARENSELREQNRSLIRQVKDYSLLQRFFGKEKIDELVNQAKGRTKSKKYERNR